MLSLNLFSLGFYLFLGCFGLAFFTANLWLSEEEKSLAQLYQTKPEDIRPRYIEAAKYAYLSFRIVRFTRWGMLAGFVMIILGVLASFF